MQSLLHEKVLAERNVHVTDTVLVKNYKYILGFINVVVTLKSLEKFINLTKTLVIHTHMHAQTHTQIYVCMYVCMHAGIYIVMCHNAYILCLLDEIQNVIL